MLAIEVVSGLVFDAELRPGNVYTSNGMSDFQRPIIDRYKEQQTCLIRGDSGFVTPKVYNLCDGNRTNLLIRLKTNARLTRLAESRILYGDETDFTLAECHYYDCLYQANTWDKPLRVIIKSTRSAGALLYRHEFLVTSFKKLSPQWLYRLYQQRGQMENHIKEITQGFAFDKTDNTSFIANRARMLLSAITYNQFQNFKQWGLPEKEHTRNAATIRNRLFRIGGKITRRARKIQLRLTSANVYDNLFWETLTHIQHMRFQL